MDYFKERSIRYDSWDFPKNNIGEKWVRFLELLSLPTCVYA